MGRCRFCGATITDYEFVCDECAKQHDNEEQEEFEAQREEEGL